MRLKLALSAMTLFFVCSVAFIPQMILSRVTRVELTSAESQNYQNIIYCSGEIMETNTREIYLQTPVIANDVRVEVGDRVWRGQTLATIDIELTQSVLAQGTPATSVEQELPNIPSGIAALAAQYGLSSGDIQSAMGQYGGLAVESVPQVEHQGAALIPPEITAPISGVVTQVNLQTDVLTQTSRPVVTVSDDTAYAALVAVNEADVARIHPGDTATITGVGFSGSLTGRVERIYPVARKQLAGTAQQTVVDVELSIDDVAGTIKPGFSAKAAIATQECGEMLTVPYEAVGQDESNQEYVYVYLENRIQKRPVTTGEELTESVEVLSGLSQGELIVRDVSAVTNEAGLFLPQWWGSAT